MVEARYRIAWRKASLGSRGRLLMPGVRDRMIDKLVRWAHQMYADYVLYTPETRRGIRATRRLMRDGARHLTNPENQEVV